MKKPFLTAAAVVLGAIVAIGVFSWLRPRQMGEEASDSIKVGMLLGFTGPLESLVPPMADSADLAFAEVSASGQLLDGKRIKTVRADSTCTDTGAATAAAERLITADKVALILGADCSGVTIAVANNVTIPKGIALVSPSATSPALSTIEDNGLFFRTSPSDARQGKVLADVVKERGHNSVAVTYTNNDYGKGLSESFATAFTELGGTVAINTAHEDGKGDYSAEVAELAEAGGELLLVIGYVDQGGIGIVRAALDTGAFEIFGLPDAMYNQVLLDKVLADGNDLTGSFGTVPGSDSAGAAAFVDIATAAGLDGEGAFTGESYDAAALIALAMQKGGAPTSEAVVENMLAVANAPGEKIFPGELAKGLQILAAGGEVDYVGATNLELVGPGEAAGSYREYEVQGGEFKTIGFR